MKILQTIPAMPPSWVFRTRVEAGRVLAREVQRDYVVAEAVVLAVPRGGVPVGAPIALALDAPLDVIIPRKLPIPWDPEAGFGAVTAEGNIVLNEELVSYVGLPPEEIQRVAREVQEEIQRRTRAYRGNRPPPEAAGKLVILTDDGLASGLTMIAAIRSVRLGRPARVMVAVPVAPHDSLERVGQEADDVICLIEQARAPFAVASFYQQFGELSDEEVMQTLQQVRDLAQESTKPRGTPG